MKHPTILILFISLHTIIGFVNLDAQPLISFSKNDYKAASQNWSVSCGNSGHMYFGNSSGLLEFDGISWQLYPSPNASIIRTVAVDSARVYTGGYRELGFWERSDNNKLQYFSLADSVKSQFGTNEEFWSIFTTKNQTIFHSFAGIYLYENEHFSIIKTGGFINFTTLIKDTLYVSIYNEGIYRVENKQLVPVIEDEFLKDKYVRFIAKNALTGMLYIGTESDGLFSYNSNNGQFSTIAANLQSFFKTNKINHGALTNEGNIIIGTILNGIIAFSEQGEIKYHYNNENGLQSNTVLGISFDRFNNIWLALDAGIEYLANTPVNCYKNYIEKDIGAVYSGALYNGDLFLGTNQGLYVKRWDEPNSKFSLVDGTQGQVWDCEIIDNHLFIGHNKGTFISSGNNFSLLSDYSGAYNIKRHPRQQDVLLQGTYNDLIVYRKTQDGWKMSNTISGFNNLTRFIEVDHLGNLWASHFYNGLYKIRLNDELDNVESVIKYDKFEDGPEQLGHLNVFKIENQIVITTGHQLYTYDVLRNTIVPFSFLNGAVGDFKAANRMVPGPNHHYWFVSDKGIAYFKIYANDVSRINFYPKQLFENHLIPDHENIVQLNDTTAMVCLENGYMLLNLNNHYEGTEIELHEIQLRQVNAANKKGDQFPLRIKNNTISLPHSLNNLTLRYSFPLLNGEKVRFQYKIPGLYAQWSALSAHPTIELSRIPSGTYTIEVKAVNNWLKSSKIHQLKLIVNAPWYQTTYAITGYSLLMIGLMLGLKYITSRKIKLKEKRKREEKEKELIQLKNEKLSSELSYKSQKLASSAMSIIKKNEFLLSLKAKMKKHKEYLGNRYPDKYYQEVIDKIDENISGQDDWQLFEANFEQAHEAFLKTMKKKHPELTPSDLRLCAYLRINLTSKDIAPLLGITVRGVENHRYRLRKKLGLTAEDNLTDYILNA
ncbi:regulator [Carboxylicivirga mesophila]|uniref:Regulator n=1 Tax=Carboxylicivirga mesophila TaxID=1166478 RepID=A0ABS5K8P5_9BACT|nr:triple tyrosine motif-containing protein [Carboxylicivirga mesophila]MBS2211374.1 regulator [Carboxylicivirga mesophila]